MIRTDEIKSFAAVSIGIGLAIGWLGASAYTGLKRPPFTIMAPAILVGIAIAFGGLALVTRMLVAASHRGNAQIDRELASIRRAVLGMDILEIRTRLEELARSGTLEISSGPSAQINSNLTAFQGFFDFASRLGVNGSEWEVSAEYIRPERNGVWLVGNAGMDQSIMVNATSGVVVELGPGEDYSEIEAQRGWPTLWHLALAQVLRVDRGSSDTNASAQPEA